MTAVSFDGFQERLRLALDRRGMSQNDLETRAGLSSGHVSRLLGRAKTIELGTLDKISIALGVDPGWLATGRGKMAPDQAAESQVPPSQPQLRHATGYEESAEEIRSRFKRYPEDAIEEMGGVMGLKLPERVDVYALVQILDGIMALRELRAKGEIHPKQAELRARLAAEDALADAERNRKQTPPTTTPEPPSSRPSGRRTRKKKPV